MKTKEVKILDKKEEKKKPIPYNLKCPFCGKKSIRTTTTVTTILDVCVSNSENHTITCLNCNSKATFYFRNIPKSKIKNMVNLYKEILSNWDKEV